MNILYGYPPISQDLFLRTTTIFWKGSPKYCTVLQVIKGSFPPFTISLLGWMFIFGSFLSFSPFREEIFFSVKKGRILQGTREQECSRRKKVSGDSLTEAQFPPFRRELLNSRPSRPTFSHEFPDASLFHGRDLFPLHEVLWLTLPHFDPSFHTLFAEEEIDPQFPFKYSLLAKRFLFL